jgi:high affinity sulfate transporter 1
MGAPPALRRVNNPGMQTSTGRRASRLSLAPGILPYQRTWLARDVVAGATLAAVAIPEGLGYAKIAGMPPETGLYTCLLPVVAFALFASTRRLVIGADSATAAISASAVGILAMGDPDRFFALSCLLAIMSGVLLLAAGWLRLGFLSDFMSRSVLAGFLTGVGIQIAIGQLDGMLGVAASGDTTWQKFVSTVQQVPDANIPDTVLSLAVITTILGLGRFAPKVPGPLLAVVGSIVLAGALDWQERRDIEMVGALPAGLPALQVPTAPLSDILALVPTALVVLLVCVAQSVSTASAFAIQHDDRHDANRDLTGLGVANIVNGLGSSFVVNGSPTKTGISDKSGTQTQLAMVVLALITIPVLLFLTGVFDSLPEATLAAVVFVIAIHLMKISTLRMLWHLPHRGEFWVAVSTAAFVALVGVGGGILWAIVASIVLHLAHTSRPTNVVLTADGEGRRSELLVAPGVRSAPGLVVYRFAATLFYANSARLVEDVRALVQGAPEPVRLFVLEGSEVHGVDWTSAEAMRKAIQLVREAGATFVFARVTDEARDELDYHGISDLVGGDAGYFPTALLALKAHGYAELAARVESLAGDMSRGLDTPPVAPPPS